MMKKIAAGLVTALAVSMFAAPANAEGNFETSVSGVRDGYKTRGVDRSKYRRVQHGDYSSYLFK